MKSPDEVKWYRYRRTPITTAAGPWLAAWLVSRALLANANLGAGWRVAVALAPLAFFGYFLRRVLVHLRASDELQRRIQLEALAIAFPLTVALLMTMGLLDAANMDLGAGWSPTALLIYAAVFYLLGRAISNRRYT